MSFLRVVPSQNLIVVIDVSSRVSPQGGLRNISGNEAMRLGMCRWRKSDLKLTVKSDLMLVPSDSSGKRPFTVIA
jgi:hypothetical protein